MADAYETLVRWYLRFNGYLSVENFIVHEPVDEGNIQGGETDIIGVRFPYSHEDVGFPIVNDCRLFDEEVAVNSLIDFVIAEVKTSRRSNLNKIWTENEEIYVDKVAYMIRWMGFLSDERAIHNLAQELKAGFRGRERNYLVRLIYFTRKHQRFVSDQGIPQITIREILDFFFKIRTPSYQQNNLGVRSPHDQWEPLIKDIWSIGDPTISEDYDTKLNSSLSIRDR
jgi:hypothetical protein